MPHIVDAMHNGRIQLLINTPRGSQAHADGDVIRTAAHQLDIPIVTTLSAAVAAVQGIKALQQKPIKTRSLQVHHRHD